MRTYFKNVLLLLERWQYHKREFYGATLQVLSEERIAEIRAKNVTPAVKPYYSKPLHVRQGYKQWVWDVDGRRYLDLYAGVVTTGVGHSHPRVVRAASEQIARLAHISTYYVYDSYLEYAEKLAARLPGKLKVRASRMHMSRGERHNKSRRVQSNRITLSQVVYLVNSGGEANDLALLMARLYSGCPTVVALRCALLAIRVTSYELRVLVLSWHKRWFSTVFLFSICLHWLQFCWCLVLFWMRPDVSPSYVSHDFSWHYWPLPSCLRRSIDSQANSCYCYTCCRNWTTIIAQVHLRIVHGIVHVRGLFSAMI